MPHHYGNSRAIWDHTVLTATQQTSHSLPVTVSVCYSSVNIVPTVLRGLHH